MQRTPPAADHNNAMAISDLNEARIRVHPIGSENSRSKRPTGGPSGSIVSLLRARQLHVGEAIQRRIEACTDVKRLDLWLLRASTVDLAEDIFGDPAPRSR